MRDIRLEDELKNCDFVRTALMLCIVVYHAMLFWHGDWFTYVQPFYDAKDTLGRLAVWMNSWHIYAFVVLSGYLYYYLAFEDGRYDDGKKFIMNKVRRLLVPAYCIGVILVIPTAYYFHADVSVVWKYLIGVNSSHMWFLFMLFWVFTFAIKMGGGYTQ